MFKKQYRKNSGKHIKSCLPSNIWPLEFKKVGHDAGLLIPIEAGLLLTTFFLVLYLE